MPGSNGSLLQNKHLILSLVESHPPHKIKREWERVKEVYDRTAHRFRKTYERQAWERVEQYLNSGRRDESLLMALAITMMTDWPEQRNLSAAELTDALFLNILTGFELGGKQQFRALGGKGPFKLTDPIEKAALEQRARAMSAHAIFKTLDRKLFMWMTQGVLAGYKPGEAPMNYGYLIDVSHRVALLDGYNQGRSRVVHKSWKGGEMQKAWRHAGVDLKRRDSHVAVEGMTIGLHELFPVGMGGVRYPHDWENAGCEEWCNCHCYVEYLPGKNAQVKPWNGGRGE